MKTVMLCNSSGLFGSVVLLPIGFGFTGFFIIQKPSNVWIVLDVSSAYFTPLRFHPLYQNVDLALCIQWAYMFIEEEPESVRRAVIAYMSSVALDKKDVKDSTAQRAWEVYDIFQHNFYDTGKAGLVFACYEAVR